MKIKSKVIAKSVSFSSANALKPLPVNIGILLVTKATNITISIGIVASRITRPIKIIKPHTILNEPAK